MIVNLEYRGSSESEWQSLYGSFESHEGIWDLVGELNMAEGWQKYRALLVTVATA